MTTPSGQLKFSDIQTEFGPNIGSQHNLGQYRINQTVGDRTWRLDDNIPIPGQQIKFSDLLGKTLNCVVDYGSEETRVSSGTKFDTSATVIGGFKSIPSRSNNTQTKKVYHLVRNILGATTETTAVALRTNTWDASTLLLRYIVTASGRLYGRGGTGGGGTGQNGSPAFGVEQSCQLVVETSGAVRGGGGGGGQGGNYSFGSFNFSCSAPGGTGGTGAGYNNQDGADAGGGPPVFCRANGNDCNPGSTTGSGAGFGGDGGDWGSSASNGCNAATTGPITGFPLFESESLGSGSSAGSGGASIIRTSSGLTVTTTNNGTISGDQNAVGSFT